jgi:transcriptional regulator with XRE-family HTH domain
MTQEGLAEAVGIDRSHLSNLERAQTLPSVLLLLELSRALGVTCDRLLGRRSKAA